ncbi:MAG TPA: methyltransferase domain-containing protein [Terriglobia bacterium]|nr:methyltransferase domain-containing protein [Terriglobia bacterium]
MNRAPILTSLPIPLVCPACHGALAFHADRAECRTCAARYAVENGIPDLIVGGRFEDAEDAALYQHEEATCTHTTLRYMIPLIRRLTTNWSRPPRILSLGCGLGTDVDLLCEAGFDAVGVDCGNRATAWSRRQFKERLYLANGKHLPFETATFDLAYCGCVFPHVGVVGDTNQVRDGFFEERLAVAKEMTRVLHPDGYLLVSSPNRLFPLDLFHGRSPGKQIWPRLNPPTNPFLLSARDYRRLFRQAGWQRSELLPIDDYWGFLRRNQSWLGRLTALPVKTVFWLCSLRIGRPLRSSPLSPWLIMLFRR